VSTPDTGVWPASIAATREELAFQLKRGDAHLSFLDAVADFPIEAINVRPPNVDHSFWHLVEHVRICQIDMLDYLRRRDYEALALPEGLWPAPGADASPDQWVESVERFRADLDAVEEFVMDEGTGLWTAAAQAWEPSHTPLRTVMMMVDHNAYHAGELSILRQVMGLWPAERVDRFTIEAIETQHRPPDSTSGTAAEV
jgi:hypothetical protein